MINKDLKSAVAGRNAKTVRVIFFVAIVMTLSARYDILTQPAHACYASGVLEIDVLENGNWVYCTDQTIYVAKDSTVDFRALPYPCGRTWATGYPIWGGAATGKTGDEIEVTFGTLGQCEVTAELEKKTVTVEVFKVDSINGYVYGDSGHKIEHMEALSNPANVIASGYMKFEAEILPSGVSDDLYYKWTATDGTLVAPSEGTGVNIVKWDAPNGHKTNVTLTLEVKSSSWGPTLVTKEVSLKTIRPYVVRVKFVDDWYPVFADGEQQIAENGSGDNPEYDAAVPKSGPVCYEKYQDMQVEVDIAGEKNATAGNNLTKKTEIRLTAKATFSQSPVIERQFDEDSMENNTTNWSDPDYGDVKLQCDTNLPNLVAEYENFEIQWTFTVKNSSGAWIKAYEEESGFSHKTIHKETAGGKTYGFYLIYDDQKFDDSANFKKLILDYVCNWANGKNTPNDIRNDIINNGFSNYTYNENNMYCELLSASFVRACLAVGLDAKQHVWTLPQSFKAGGNPTNQLYDGPNASWRNVDTFSMKSYPINGIAYGWSFHAWAESDSVIYDPSAQAAGGDGTPSSGSWGDYEDACIDDYKYIIDTTLMVMSEWVDNPSGHSSDFNDAGDHVYHYEYNDETPAFPEFVEP